MTLCSDCETCQEEKCRFNTPSHGDEVKCDMCGKVYSYFIWAFGSDRYFCRKCVHKTPQSYLDKIDAIDIEAEHDIISAEIAEQDNRDFPKSNRHMAQRQVIRLSKSASRKIQRRMDKAVIKRFKQKEGAVDVTGLG